MKQEKNNIYAAMIQPIKISADLSREEIYELGRKCPYKQYMNFPVSITTEFCLGKRFEHPYFYGTKIIRGL